MSKLNILAALILFALFAYWEIAERRLKIDRTRSPRKSPARRFTRYAVLLLGLILLLQLLGIFVLPLPIPSGLVRNLFVIGHGMFIAGVVVCVWARQAMGDSWAHGADYQVRPGQALITTGPFRFIRHPIYAGLLLIFLGLELALTSWLAILIVPLTILVLHQARAEEQLLLAAFGEQYCSYQKHTGRFFPKL